MAQASWVGNYHHVFSKAPLSRATYMTCPITTYLAHLAMRYSVYVWVGDKCKSVTVCRFHNRWRFLQTGADKSDVPVNLGFWCNGVTHTALPGWLRWSQGSRQSPWGRWERIPMKLQMVPGQCMCLCESVGLLVSPCVPTASLVQNSWLTPSATPLHQQPLYVALWTLSTPCVFLLIIHIYTYQHLVF